MLQIQAYIETTQLNSTEHSIISVHTLKQLLFIILCYFQAAASIIMSTKLQYFNVSGTHYIMLECVHIAMLCLVVKIDEYYRKMQRNQNNWIQ